MDVGPLFIPHTQAAKLIEPGKGAFDDPPPPAPSIADQVTLTAALGPIGGIRPGLVTQVDSADATTVHDHPRPINLVVASKLAAQNGSDPTRPPLANRAGAASTSSQIRT